MCGSSGGAVHVSGVREGSPSRRSRGMCDSATTRATTSVNKHARTYGLNVARIRGVLYSWSVGFFKGSRNAYFFFICGSHSAFLVGPRESRVDGFPS